MAAVIIEPDNRMWVIALKNMYDRKEITLEQYANCLRRSQSYI